jgi:hypothetical protein
MLGFLERFGTHLTPAYVRKAMAPHTHGPAQLTRR